MITFDKMSLSAVFGIFAPIPVTQLFASHPGVRSSMARKLSASVMRTVAQLDSDAAHKELTVFFKTLMEKIFALFKNAHAAQQSEFISNF